MHVEQDDARSPLEGSDRLEGTTGSVSQYNPAVNVAVSTALFSERPLFQRPILSC